MVGIAERMAEGDGVVRAEVERLAARGSAGAQYNLGLIYANGWDVHRDEFESTRWYRHAAEQGCDRAQFNLALVLDQGPLPLRDRVEAALWYSRAAERGDPVAMGNTGLCYLVGRGVPQDVDEAFTWLTSAVALGNTSLRPAQELALAAINTGWLPETPGIRSLFVHRPRTRLCRLCRCDRVACQADCPENMPASIQHA